MPFCHGYCSFLLSAVLITCLCNILDPFCCRLRGLGMNLPGAYRKLVAFPWDLTWKYVPDEHACTGNISTDHCAASTGSNPKCHDVKRPRLGEDETICTEATELTVLPQSSDNLYNNIEISFSLAPSCYATSCIRELMKN